MSGRSTRIQQAETKKYVQEVEKARLAEEKELQTALKQIEAMERREAQNQDMRKKVPKAAEKTSASKSKSTVQKYPTSLKKFASPRKVVKVAVKKVISSPEMPARVQRTLSVGVEPKKANGKKTKKVRLNDTPSKLLKSWACKKCTLINVGEDIKCKACKRRAPSSTSK